MVYLFMINEYLGLYFIYGCSYKRCYKISKI
jgi:hypothetical protein